MDYVALADTVADLISEFGQPATLNRTHALVNDPSRTIDVDATGKTFTRSSGSWVTDGFAVGDTVTFSGFADAGNNGAFVVSDVDALVLTCTTASGLVDVTGALDVAASAVTALACDVFEESVNSVSAFAQSLVAGSLVTESTRFFLVAGSEPKANDRLVVGAVEYAVEGVRPMSPGATALYWTARVKA